MTETITKSRGIIFTAESVRAILAGKKTQTRRVVKFRSGFTFPHEVFRFKVGDTLYVKETFYIDHIDYADRQPIPKLGCPTVVDDDMIFYPADAPDQSRPWCCQLIPECSCAEVGKPKVRGAMFMPPWASRLTLQIEGVKVERVQDISEVDADHEGCPSFQTTSEGESEIKARDVFAERWDAINGKSYPWASNPWVWCISFRVLPAGKEGQRE